MLNEFHQKMLDCFHDFSDPKDPVIIKLSLDEEQRNVIMETDTAIPLAHEMSIERFLNAPVAHLKNIAKGLYKDIKKVV